MVVTPTLTYASGTWTLTQKHEKMIKTAQRKMLRLIVQTKRKYKTKKKATSKKDEEPGMPKDEDNENTSEKDTEDDSQQDSNKVQDSEVSFQEEADEEIDATENEEDWVEFIKRSTKEAEERMKNTRYHAGLKYTGEQHGEWHEESFLYLKKDGTEEFPTGILDLTQAFVLKDMWADPKEGGKTISTSLQKQRREMKKLNTTLRTKTAGWTKYKTTKNGKKMKKSSQRSGKVFSGRKAQHLVLAFYRKPSTTASVDMSDVPCFTATYEHVRGTGRHLAAHLADVPLELPQLYRRGNRGHPDSETIDISTILMDQRGTR